MNDRKLNQLLNHIRTAIPDIQIHSSQIMNTGETNDVLLVNTDRIFRFPRLPKDTARLKQEYELLTSLRGQLPLPTPNPIYHHLDADTHRFMEYAVLSGEPLSKYIKQAKAYMKPIAVQLADFVLALHQVPVDNIVLPIQNVGRNESLPEFFRTIQAVLFPHLAEEAQRQVSQIFADSINLPDIEPDKLIVRHGDLGPNNILINPKTLHLTGIIDFGSAGLDEPASDLGHIAFWGTLNFGQEFVKAFLNHYGTDGALRERTQLYSTLIACIVALGDLEDESGQALQAALRYLSLPVFYQ